MYQPQISDENIRKLHKLKTKFKKPMTHILNKIMDDFFASYQEKTELSGKGVIYNIALRQSLKKRLKL
jgi:tRNA A37 threonylcarbamoyltransferase TsaD